MFECLAALKVDRLKSDCAGMKRIVELIEEEEECEEAEDLYDDNNDEVFSLELERDERGLGLALVDTGVSERSGSHLLHLKGKVQILNIKEYTSRHRLTKLYKIKYIYNITLKNK